MEKVSECWQEGISQKETPYKDTCSHTHSYITLCYWLQVAATASHLCKCKLYTSPPTTTPHNPKIGGP